MRITTIVSLSAAFAAAILIGRFSTNLNHTAVPSSSTKSTSYSHPNPVQADSREPEQLKHIPDIASLSFPAQNPSKQTLLSTENPSSIDEEEALASAAQLLEDNNTRQYQVLRQAWKGKENQEAQWAFFDAQAKFVDGRPKEAATILESKRFQGKEESGRLVRLAGIYMIENPDKAQLYLSEAIKNDPWDSDLHTYLGSLKEALEQHRTAGKEYIAAVQYDRSNPYKREQLADFYLRTRQYKQALQILEDAMAPPSLDSIWVKTLFWSRLTIPTKNQWQEKDIPKGSLNEFAHYLLALPSGTYWDAQAFEELPDHQIYLESQQETFWLQLISALKNGEEKEALDLLNNNRFFKASWAPDLEKGLKTLILFQFYENISRRLSFILPLEDKPETPQQLLQLLASLSEAPPEHLASLIPIQLHNLLLEKAAFAIPFLAVGWSEAAIQLHNPDEISDQYPFWIIENTAKAIGEARGSKSALSFALTKNSSSEISLLKAKLALEVGEERLAFNNLKEIYTEDNDSGRNAALLLGQFLADHRNLADARKAILAHPSLADEPSAKAILARAALEEGDVSKAAVLYRDLENASPEAKSFLAKKAFAEKDWTRARILTEALLKEQPDHPTLQENLRRIIAEEKRDKEEKREK